MWANPPRTVENMEQKYYFSNFILPHGKVFIKEKRLKVIREAYRIVDLYIITNKNPKEILPCRIT